jgi:hypothetical protein
VTVQQHDATRFGSTTDSSEFLRQHRSDIVADAEIALAHVGARH